MNPTPVLWTLRSMFPFRLHFVRIVGRASWALEFTRNLRRARLEQAKHHASLSWCAACRRFVMDHAKQVVPGFRGCPLMQCVACKKAFCCRVDCPVDVRECCECGIVGCQECDSISQCIVCRKSLCTHCSDSFVCTDCAETVCDDCAEITSS